ncbi:hypothetical protein RIF29_33416 [Crotalaria pallida]|uniref:Uncharacterized protein n=1 Tax=Crotalaria pallida TaxID=3830 RepID=A0AAN9HSR6_CROPI
MLSPHHLLSLCFRAELLKTIPPPPPPPHPALTFSSSLHSDQNETLSTAAPFASSTLRLSKDQGEAADGILLEDDPSEPTMGEKLAASLSLLDGNKSKSDKEQESYDLAKPPSADSAHVLLKQALNADDRTLLLDCLYTQDEKVIRKSVADLHPSNVLKLLRSLISITESRGAILACAEVSTSTSFKWNNVARIAIASFELFLIEARVSTFESAVRLSSCLDILYTGVIEEEVDEGETIPVIYEDKDSEDESDDAMETDQDSEDEKQSGQAFDDVSDIDGIVMM